MSTPSQRLHQVDWSTTPIRYLGCSVGICGVVKLGCSHDLVTFLDRQTTDGISVESNIGDLLDGSFMGVLKIRLEQSQTKVRPVSRALLYSASPNEQFGLRIAPFYRHHRVNIHRIP